RAHCRPPQYGNPNADMSAEVFDTSKRQGARRTVSWGVPISLDSCLCCASVQGVAVWPLGMICPNCQSFERDRMSALGHLRTWQQVRVMSAFPLKADIAKIIECLHERDIARFRRPDARAAKHQARPGASRSSF